MVRLLWAPAMVVLAHAAAASAFGHQAALDPFFHFLGGIAGASTVLAAFRRWPSLPGTGRLGPRRAALAVVLVVAVLWEAGELVLNHLRWARIRTDVPDTAMDLVLGVTGALTRIVLARGRV
jgi:hypothetical protein